MHNLTTLKNGLTLITVDLPHLDSVTTLIGVGAGSRYETKNINGISHFLEHMFFKGSTKFPTAEIIATLLDGIGSVNNAGTAKEYTVYWVKSAAKHVGLASDILSSMLKESLLAEEEIGREKGVIIEELRMYRDNPTRYVWDLYERLQFGDQPLGWDIGGEEKIVNSLKRADFVSYMDYLYSPQNMVLVYAGKLPKNIRQLAGEFFQNLPKRSSHSFNPYKRKKQTKPRVNIFYKKTDQVHLVLGVEGYDRYNSKRYAARILATILGEGMSSRLFISVRERRGLAYHVDAGHETFKDTGFFASSAGLKLEKVEEGLEVIVAELQRVASEKVTDDELKKGKEIIRGRLAIRQESTNFLAEYFGTEYVLDRQVESFDDYLKKIDEVGADDIKEVAQELFVSERINLQIIGPFKDTTRFEKILRR